MTITEQIKIRCLQGTPVADMMVEFNCSRQRISAAKHTPPKHGKRGAKVKPLVCRDCGIALTAENKTRHDRRCKPCTNAYVRAQRFTLERIQEQIDKLQRMLRTKRGK